jgi:hypothetical protein
MRTYGRVAAQVCLVVLGGCTFIPPHTQTFANTVATAEVEEARSRRSLSTLTSAEITTVHGMTTLDAIRRFRPEFLRGSTRVPGTGRPQIAVYVDDVYDGDTSTLNSIPVEWIQTILFLHPMEAMSRFGTACRCASGVILVRTSRPSRTVRELP